MFYASKRELAEELLREDPDAPVFVDIWDLADAEEILTEVRGSDSASVADCTKLLEWFGKDYESGDSGARDSLVSIASRRMP